MVRDQSNYQWIDSAFWLPRKRVKKMIGCQTEIHHSTVKRNGSFYKQSYDATIEAGRSGCHYTWTHELLPVEKNEPKAKHRILSTVCYATSLVFDAISHLKLVIIIQCLCMHQLPNN